MTPEELAKAVGAAAATALEPHTKSMEELKGTIDKQAVKIEDLDKRLKNRKIPGLDDEAAKNGFSLRAVLFANKMGNKELASREVSILTEFDKKHGDDYRHEQQKALSTDVDVSGGFLVPTQVIPEIIELLRAQQVAVQLGARMMDGLTSSPVEIPRLTGAATADWTAEGATATESDETFGDLKLQTRQLVALVRVSNLLLAQGVPSVEQLIREDIAQVIGLKMDIGVLKGTGASNEPLGIFNTTGINNTTSLASVTIDKLMDAQTEVKNANANRGKLGWAFSPNGFNIVRKLKDAQGRFHLAPDVSQEANPSILGAPFAETTQLATADVIYGNWEDVFIAQWGAMEFRISSEAEDVYKKNQSLIRAIMLADVGVRHGESFYATSNLTA